VDYKETINLPNTAFSMKANLSSREPKFLDDWYHAKFYEEYFKHDPAKETFILHSGPPYANGDIHIGHALNNILKDIIVKCHRMSGKNISFIPGWDCHGLPIEHQVEKKFGKVGEKIAPKEFREKCREYAQTQIENQKSDLMRLGIIADWNNPYLTMSSSYEAKQFELFASLLERGVISKGYKPVHWCLDCGSALAEAEVEYIDKNSTAVDVGFKVKDPQKICSLFDLNFDQNEEYVIPIWTTTPWTLPGNQALTINPEITYSLVRCQLRKKNMNLLIAEELIKSALERYGIEGEEILGYSKGSSLVGILCEHPIEARMVPIILGDHVTVEEGTGIVHTAPGHGQDDFIVGKENDLPLDCRVNAKGLYTDEVAFVAGKHIYKAQTELLEIIEKNQLLFANYDYSHSYPHCWRHKTPLIFRATPQWFISMDQNHLRERSLNAITKVDWIPAWGEERIKNMVKDRPDWCISRQRYWGVPIPLFIHKETDEIHPQSSEIIARMGHTAKEKGIEAWHEINLKDYAEFGLEEYYQVEDVMDVWLDSGLSHSVVFNNQIPISLYLEGSDQHRGWFQSSLLSSVALYDQSPYLSVLTHGFTVDEHGRKMSKSLGNVIKPQEIYNSTGADILRLWVAATDYKGELKISDEILKRVTDAYRRIRNTFRYMLGNLHDFNHDTDTISIEEMTQIDLEMIFRMDHLQKEILNHYSKYELHLIFQKVHNFCSKELGGFYFDIIKDRLYTCSKQSRARKSAQVALNHILNSLIRICAPIISFTADEVWFSSNYYNGSSILLDEWYSSSNLKPTQNINWEMLEELRDAVLIELENARKGSVIGSALEAEIYIESNSNNMRLLQPLKDELKFLFITSAVHLHEDDSVKGFQVKVQKSAHEKCVRCWHQHASVDDTKICHRCKENISNEEKRVFF